MNCEVKKEIGKKKEFYRCADERVSDFIHLPTELKKASHETLKESFAKLEGVMRCEMFDKIVELKKEFEKELGEK